MSTLNKIKQMQNLKKDITKDRVTLTLDIDLIVKLNEFKKRQGIKKLSPLVNVMMWDLLNELEAEEKSQSKKEGTQLKEDKELMPDISQA